MYTLIVDDLRARVIADRGIAATFKAAGSDIELPDPDAERQRFDDWLVSPLVIITTVQDRERLELIRALGLRA